MNERQILALKATIESGTTVGAAEVLNISQSAISQLLTGLENEVGFALLDRQRGRVHPTPHGKKFLQQASSILDALEHTRQAADALRGLAVGNVRIGCSIGFAIHIMPSVLASLHLKYPDINASLQARPSAQVREMVHGQIFDVGLCEPAETQDENPEHHIVIPSVCVFRAGDALEKKDAIRPEDLRDRKLVSLYSRHSSSRQLKEIFLKAQQPWSPVIETNLFAAACEFVSQTDAVAIVDPYTPMSYPPGVLSWRPFLPTVPITLEIIFSQTIRFPEFLGDLEAGIRKELGQDLSLRRSK